MFHQPLTLGISGQTEDVLRHANEMERLRNLLAEIISQKTGLSKKKVLKDLFDRDTYLSPDKALKLNIIDEII
jgi:ATP-dependent Clp protease protease subunit